MESVSKSVQPMELSEFKNLGPNMPTTIIDIPEKMENRVATDKYFTIVFGVCVILLMPFLIYTLAYSDIRRLLGTDSCGNVCGSTNYKYDQWSCTGQDFTDKPYLSYGSCVNKTEYLEDHTFEGFQIYLLKGSVIFRLIVCSFITVGVSIGVLYLFRYNVGLVVWSIIIADFVLTVIVIGMMWADYAEEKNADAVIQSGPTLTLCLISTVFLLIFAGFIYFCRNKIRLVILLLIETTNAIFAMPSLLIVPFITFLTEGVIFSIFLTTTIHMLTAGELVEESPGQLEYVMTSTMSTTIFFNFVITIWSLYIVSGFQYMVIGGAVSEWYFAKDKMSLERPIKKSATIAYKFHLGTVAFGSLVITLAYLVRITIKGLVKNKFMKICLNCCLSILEELLEFITEKAYIITAMHGQPFLKSGKRAATLILQNLCNMIDISWIRKLVFTSAILFVGLVSVLLSMILFVGDDEESTTAVLIIIFIMALFISITFFASLQTTIDTIFICFCEDSILNDGMARPYAMSKDLMEFVQNSKKIHGEKQVYDQFESANPQPV